MGRPKGYERPKVVAKAQQVFWQKGWEATSLHDLEMATGLNKFSLYSEFASKKGLYLACLEVYVSDLLLPVFEAFDPAAPDGPVGFLMQVVDQLEAHPRLGCFLLNASQEASGQEAALVPWMDQTYGRLRAKVADHWKDEARAEAYVLAVRGLMVSGRLGTAPAALRRAVQGLVPLFQDYSSLTSFR